MKSTFAKFVIAAAVLLALSAPVFGHHGSRISYDLTKMVTLTGTVTEFQWQNPHVYIKFDVTDKDGKVTNWGAETYSPVVMTRDGWGRRTLKTGDKVTITVWPSKIGTPLGFLAKVVHPDGHVTDLSGGPGPE
jgi:uncharacterized protein DUF6152